MDYNEAVVELIWFRDLVAVDEDFGWGIGSGGGDCEAVVGGESFDFGGEGEGSEVAERVESDERVLEEEEGGGAGGAGGERGGGWGEDGDRSGEGEVCCGGGEGGVSKGRENCGDLGGGDGGGEECEE